MNIWIEKTDNDIARILEFSGYNDIYITEENERILDVKNFDDMFLLMKNIQIKNGENENCSPADSSLSTEVYNAKKDCYLVYVKSLKTVIWNNTVLPGSIDLTTNAVDNDSDGVPDIPADGSSTCKIIIRKRDYKGALLQGAEDNDVINFSLTRGSLDALSLNLVNGYGEVVLTSVPETVETFVNAESESLQGAFIKIQFRPVE